MSSQEMMTEAIGIKVLSEEEPTKGELGLVAREETRGRRGGTGLGTAALLLTVDPLTRRHLIRGKPRG